MINTALYFLHKVAKEIPNNQFARAFYNQLKNAGDVVDWDSLEFLKIPFKEEMDLAEMDYSKIERKQDFRFLYLFLKAVRKFPLLSKDDEYYGVSFCDKEKDSVVPVNTLIQGGNGTGKTSLFAAMEYLFTGKTSAAFKQGFIGEAGVRDYLPFAGGKLEEVDMKVVTRSLHFSLGSDGFPRKDLLPLCLHSFFCSEYDVDKLISDKLDRFIYEQMGYTSVSKIIENMDREIRAAGSQHDTLDYTIESVASQIAVLDGTIGMYERLNPSFLSLVFSISTKAKPNELLKQLMKFLSKDFVLQYEKKDFKTTKLFEQKNVKEEKDALSRILGKNAQSQYLMQLYSKADQYFQTEIEGLDPLLLTQTNRSEEMTKVLKELNYARKTFSNFIRELLNREVSSDRVSELVFYIKMFENRVQDLKDRRQQEEIKKEKLGEDQLYMTNKETYDEFLRVLKTKVYKTIKDITDGARDMLNEIMELFITEDEKMHFDFDENQGKFKMNITLVGSKGETSDSLSPEKYLNTFRYKLYCVSLKIAIAFAMKKFYEMNFPIVIDDLFYSSDFEHRGMVREFFHILFMKHREIFSNDDLQVIFLSHDEVVIEAAYRGISDIVSCSRVDRKMMFDYREADPSVKVTLPVETKNGQSIVVNMTNLTCS